MLPDLAQRDEKIILTPAAGVTLGPVTAAGGAAWLKPVVSENRPTEIDLTIDTTGLTAASYASTVTITAGSTTQVVPINIKVVTPNFTDIIADPGRNRVYLLHAGSPSRILVLDAVKGTVIRQVPVFGSYLMTLAKDGSALHMLAQPNNRIFSLDLQRMTLDGPIPLGPEVTRTNENFSNLDSGPNGTIYFINSNYVSSVFAVEAATGRVIQRLDYGDGPGTWFGKFRISADAKKLYAALYDGQNSGTLLPPLFAWDVAADGSLTPAPDEAPALINSLDFSSDFQLLNSADGRRVAISDLVFEPGNFQGTCRDFPEIVKAVSGEGGFVVGDTWIYNADGSVKLADMPLPANPKTVAVTPEGRVFYAAKFRYGFVDVPALAGAQAAGLANFPADQSNGPPPAELKWLPVQGARDYRIYLSQNAADLQPAQVAPSVTAARSTTPRLTLPVAVSPGETWYWRVDAFAPSGLVRGTVRQFSAADFGVPARSISMGIVKGCKAQPVAPALVMPASGTLALGTDKPWVKVAPAGNSFEVDSTLISGSTDTATLTFTHQGTVVQVPLQVRLQTSDHHALLTGPATSRAFAVVKSHAISDGGNVNVFGPFYVTRLNPANGDMLECRNIGFGVRSLLLSRDESELAVESPVSVPTKTTGGVQIFDAADLSPLKRIIATGGYNTSSGDDIQTALTGGHRMITAITFFNWQTGEILGRGDHTTGPLNAFSPDGKTLYGADVNSVFRHNANSANLAFINSFSQRDLGTDRVLMARDGSLFIHGTLYLDANLQLLRTAPFMALRTNADASVVAGTTGLYHTRSLRKIGPLPALGDGSYTLGFCDPIQTLVYYAGNPANAGVPDYNAQSLAALLALDGSTLVPAIPNGSTYSGESVVLKWSDMQGADSFRVFFGTDAAAVAAAGPGSPLELGVVSAAEWSPALPVVGGSTYFWKVIAQGPAGTSSSPVWSFQTATLRLGKAAMSIMTPVESNPTDARNSITVASPTASWSVSTTTPWIELPQTAGTGSGSFIVRVKPAGFAAGTQQGSVTVNSGSESVVIPVTMKNYRYQPVEHVTERDGPYVHILVSDPPDFATTGPMYMMKVDTATLKHVETIDLGLTYVGSNELRVCHHPTDGRIYIYYSGVRRLLGINSSEYEIVSNIDAVPLFSNRAVGEICQAGPGRLAVISSELGLSVHNSTTGAKLANYHDADSSDFNRVVSSPSGDRFYVTNSNPWLQRFDFSGTQLTAGPFATTFTATGGGFGISDDGNTIFNRRGYYNTDLTLLGQFPQGVFHVNADGTRFLVGTTAFTQALYMMNRQGAVLGWFPQFANFKITWNQQTGRLFHRQRSGSAYEWVDTKNIDTLAFPALPGGGQWTSSGGRPWTHTSGSPQIMRTPRAYDPAFSDLGRAPSLTFVAAAAGTLSFEVRNITTGTDTVNLSVDGADVDSVPAVSSFVTKSRAIAAGSRVAITYFTNSLSPYAEFRNITFTPAAGASPPLAISPKQDKDGDGADDLLEAALGTDSANAASRPVTRIVADGDLTVFEFQRPAGLPYRYQVQVSSDLVDWQDLSDPFSIQVADGLEQVRIPIPQAGKSSFARLSVTPLAN